jgi:recombinational DNA repair protein (RecF pathway)
VPGQQLQTTAFLLARQPSSSDSFEQFTAFGGDHGLLHCLQRSARASASRNQVHLDLFDEAEFWLESSNQGRTWFIKEHRPVIRHAGIGRSYDALRAAAAVATLVTRNPVPEDSQAPVAALLRQSFGALDQGARPDLVWFKALFCFLRDEGLPVKQHWWAQLPAAEREAAARILNQPIAGQNLEKTSVAGLVTKLENWLHAETEIKLR